MNEINSPPWAKVRVHVEEVLEGLRSKLESPTCDFAQTQILRGEIRALKRLLGLPEELAARQLSTTPPGWLGGDDA